MGAEVVLTLVRLLSRSSSSSNPSQCRAEDDIDWLCCKLTPSLFVILASVVGVRQYVFTPIQCWVPKEFDDSWEEYAENYCWVEGTYFNASIPIEKGPAAEASDRRRTILPYYQWVPITLCLQSLFFYLPHLLWKNAARPLHSAMQTAARSAKDWEGEGTGIAKLVERVTLLSRQVEPLLARNTNYLRLTACPARYVIVFFLTKIIYCVVCVCQIFLMQAFIGFPSFMFGWQLLLDTTLDKGWRHSGFFPRVSWCDFTIRKVGQSHTYSIQCVLPANMLNEKVFIFLWCWCTLILTATITNIMTWCVRLCKCQQRRQAEQWLLLQMGAADAAAVDAAATHFSTDAFLLLHLIAMRFGDAFAAALFNDLNCDLIV